MTKRIFLMCLLIVFAARLSAQQDPQFTQYMFNTIYYNPGFSGVEGVTKISALHRSQWLGYSPTYGGGGAPTTQLITFSTPIFKLNSGFGALVSHDNLGPFNNLEAQASYAYHLGVKNSKLSFGLRGGVYSQTVDFNMYRTFDANDPLLGDKTGSLTQVRPDMAAGIFCKKEKFNLDSGFSHLLPSPFTFLLTQRHSLQTHTYITGGYMYQVNFDL